MAMPAACLSVEQFTCSICLDVFNNPVSTPCGHSFCQACISAYWDGGRRGGRGGGEGTKVYLCPLCKESFRKRPELHINRTLKEITEQFKWLSSAEVSLHGPEGGGVCEDLNSHSQQQPGLPLSQKPGEMPEGVFTEMMGRFQQLQPPGRPRNSICDASNPQLTPLHNARPCFQALSTDHHDPPPPYSPPRRYTLSGASDFSPSAPLCPAHQRPLEFFCRTDNTCVCSVCMETQEHRGHNVIPAKREWQIRKSQLGISEVELQDLISNKMKKVEEIQTSLREIQAAAEKETGGVVSSFSRLITSVERCQAEVLEVIEMSWRATERKAQSLLKELEEEISELKKRSAALNQLVLCEDYVHFLKTYPTLSTPPPSKDWSGVSVVSELTSGVILRTLNQTMENLSEELRKLPEVCQKYLLDQTVARPNPKVRRVQEYADDITLDPNTSHPRLIISVDGKQVYCGERHQSVPDNPERFDRVVCVLAREGFNSGRHYWEVEVGGKTDWDLGVASWSVNRKGKITVSPAHGYWFLSLRDRTEYAFRTEPSTNLTVNLRPSRIGVYLDYDKGLVSFYDVEAKVLIYTFTDTFSDTLHPFFSPCTNKSGRNEAPLVICPVLE
ncbi:E3 ubiquitin-protein ligase TRIM39 [Cheilinus undulatus]|uniref:E3 ubiquitin-protein ligase TRIM39 n=1 Tax=Cheilinus undulatus TaxID=241271 RepID=UPI001BD1E060|nr:E3 ubiquitin-protein ligase TRIM39 [Cheilinus undulatus]